jgi:eukaryotic-like serine/threonine-protein kinase
MAGESVQAPHQRWVHAAIFASFLLGFAGCASGIHMQRNLVDRPYDWVTYGGANNRTNQSSSLITPPLKPVWEYDAVSGISGTLLVKDSVIVVGTLKGELHALRLSDGEAYGFSSVESAVIGTPVLDGNYAYVTSAQGKETVECIFLRDGKKQWGSQFGGIETAPLMIGEFLYVTTLDGTLISAKKADGKEFWKFETGPKDQRKPIHSSPASDGEVIVFGSDDGGIYAVDRLSGSLRWKFQTGASVFATPIIQNSMCLVGSLDSSFYALDTRTGKLRWRFKAGSRLYAAASASQDLVFIGGSDGRLSAVSADSGTNVWTFSAKGPVSAAPLVAGDLLYLGSLDQTLYAVRLQTGEKIWEYTVEGRIRVSPVIWGGLLLLISEDRTITAFRSDAQ